MFNVEINFKKGPSFSVASITASDETEAKALALKYARNNGFYEMVKKYKIKK